MALTGHSGMHTAQSMHSSGSITSMFGPSRKQSTGQTSTQSVYLQRIQDSVTTWVMLFWCAGGNPDFNAPLPRRFSADQQGSGGLVAGSIHQHQGAQYA